MVDLFDVRPEVGGRRRNDEWIQTRLRFSALRVWKVPSLDIHFNLKKVFVFVIRPSVLILDISGSGSL